MSKTDNEKTAALRCQRGSPDGRSWRSSGRYRHRRDGWRRCRRRGRRGGRHRVDRDRCGDSGIAGGLAGKGAAEAINPTLEDEFWRGKYVTRRTSRPAGTTMLRPHPYGWESYSQYANREFDELDETLAREWDTRRGDSQQTWQEAREAARDAWKRASDPARLPYAGRRHA